METELETVAQAWHRLGLGELGTKERKALENRRREGASLEQLRDAVAGAAEHAWLRTGARSAFAVVFANLPAVARFAHDGRKLGSSTLPPRAGSLIPWGGSRPSPPPSLASPSGPVVPAVGAVAPEAPMPMPADARAALEHLGSVFGAQRARSQVPEGATQKPLHASARRKATQVATDGSEAQEKLLGACAPHWLAASVPSRTPTTDLRDDGLIERGASRGSDDSPVAGGDVAREGSVGAVKAGSYPAGREGREGTSQQTGSERAESDGALFHRNRSLQGFGMDSARPRDPTETEHDRQRQAQEHFDRRRFELVAALRALEP